MHKIKVVSVAIGVSIIVVAALMYTQPNANTEQTIDVEDIPSVEYAKQAVPDFTKYSQVKEKKAAFFNYLKPAITVQNEYITSVRQFVIDLQAKQLSGEDFSVDQQTQLTWLIDEYRVGDSQIIEEIFSDLLRKIDIIPAELVLMQSANESAWGTSRFAKQGYNFFGLWCFKKGCGFVPKRRNKGAAHEVAKFPDLSTAMYAYMRNLNSHPAYKQLRLIRLEQRNEQKPISAYALADGLTKYSERGDEYVKELRDMMRINKELIAP
jgi:Bax protein